ncbi:MAG: response regulator, partial [Alcanivoracaceae bacterium]|nr:response regulator [Alcanivoracaceae bacterium]
LGYAELLESPELSEQERRRYLAIIQQNGDALMALISDVLDLSRIEAGQVKVERQPCDIPALMKDVLNSHMLRARHKRIDLSLRYLDAVPREIYTDAFRLRQILGNLVSNAIKFTEEGGVEVRVRWEDGLQPCLHVDIADTGIGIPAASLPHVFEPFSQVDESHTRRFGGTGLGLAIARQLARSLGGDISVRSEPREGSVFQVHIQTLAVEGSPYVQPADALAFEMQSQRLPAIRASGTVLVVDDNQVNRLLVTRVLGNAGFVVHEAENGRQALDLVVAASESFDLVVMDMQMPVMDGFEASTALRQRGYRGAVLALTANVMADDRRRCLDAGCDEFLAKPVRAGLLLETCVRLINSSAVASRRA